MGWYIVERKKGKSKSYGYRYHAVDGLERTNSNARKRQVLIHHSSRVTNDCNARIRRPMKLDSRSAGCFSISDQAFLKVDSFIRATPDRILLYAFNGYNKQ